MYRKDKEIWKLGQKNTLEIYDKKYINEKERELHLPGYFHRDLQTPAMSTDSSQVGVTLFPSY